MANESKPSFSAARRWGLLFNVVLTVTSVLAFVVMANYLASGYYKRISLGTGSRMALSAQTVKVLQSITNEVTASIFFDVHGSPEVYGWVSGLLKEYNNINPRIKVETIDFTRFPGDAAARLSKYKLSNLKDKEFVVFESGGQTKTVYANQLAEYDIHAILSGETKEFRRTSFKGEMLFTPSIFAVTHPRALKAYFLSGHGEYDPLDTANEGGFSKFAALLKEENNVEWEKLSLQGTNEIPADCQLLIIAAPSKAQLSENEITAIENYLSKGKRLFVLASRVGSYSGIEKVLNKWGVEIENCLVVDEENVATRSDLLTYQVNPNHEVTRNMFAEGLRVQMVLPRSLHVTGNFKGADAPKVEVLFSTGTNAVACFPVQQGDKVGCDYETNFFHLAVAVEQGKIKGVSAERTTRILILGDAQCLDNQLLDSAANHYFAGFAVNWLLAQPSILLEGIGPRPVEEYRLNMSAGEASRIRWLFLLGVPGAILFFGGLVWLRRRS